MTIQRQSDQEIFSGYLEKLVPGEKYTLVRESDFGIGCSVTHLTVKEAKIDKYAQYRTALKLVFRAKRKQRDWGTHLLPVNSWAIYKGHVEVNADIWGEKSGSLQKAKYRSFDPGYFKDAVGSVEVEPVIVHNAHSFKEY